MSKMQEPSTKTTLFGFLAELEARHVAFHLERIRESVMVAVALPGDRWEVEFFDDGHVEVERFRSDGEIESETALLKLWEFAD